jgi:hypothetical protein
MLVYNETRTHKTFLHPSSSDDDNDYDRILEWIEKAGRLGALGSAGGTKVFFYAKFTPGSESGKQQQQHPDILSIDVTQLAPVQEW